MSRVLNGVGPYKEETKRRVLQAAKDLNYHPNAIAQSFARRRSGNLGVIVPFLPKVHLFSTYYYSEILSGIGTKVKERGYDLLLLLRSPDEATDYTSYYNSQKVDACIILGSRSFPDEIEALRQLSTHKLPFCLVNQHVEGENMNEIDADHVTGSYEAVQHLIAQGFKNVAFINGPLDYSNSLDRLNGYMKAIREVGLPVKDELIFTGNYSRKSGYECAAAVVACVPKIDAVFVGNDRMAIGLIQGLREMECRVGEDIAVVGYDNSDASRVSDPPLSSVHVPFYEMGQLAVERLLDQVQSGQPFDPFYEKLPTNLIVRHSSQPNY